MIKSYWNDKNVLVAGGAGFIGSYLVDLLIDQGTNVTVVDNLSRGRIENPACDKAILLPAAYFKTERFEG